MVREAMTHLEAAVTEIEGKIASQHISPETASEMIARLHRIEEKITRIERDCEEHSKD